MRKLNLVADAMEKATSDGVITIDESNTSETFTEYVEETSFTGLYFIIWLLITILWKFA